MNPIDILTATIHILTYIVQSILVIIDIIMSIQVVENISTILEFIGLVTLPVTVWKYFFTKENGKHKK